MAQLRQDFTEFERRNTVILVVGPENAEAFTRHFGEHSLPFVGLPDPSRNVLALYQQKVNLFKMGRMPAQFLVDRNGLVCYAHYGRTMADIPENAEILSLIDELNAG